MAIFVILDLMYNIKSFLLTKNTVNAIIYGNFGGEKMNDKNRVYINGPVFLVSKDRPLGQMSTSRIENEIRILKNIKEKLEDYSSDKKRGR